MDYRFESGDSGPVYRNRKWFGGCHVIPGTQPSMIKRVHSFVRVLSDLWAAKGFSSTSRFIRCNGGAILKRFCCFRLPWPVEHLSRIDQYVFAKLGRQIVVEADVDEFGCLVDETAT